MFQLNMTFVRRKRSQVQLTQTPLTDGTSQQAENGQSRCHIYGSKLKRGDPSGFAKLQLVAKNEKKIEGGTLWGHEKISQKFLKMRFLNSVTVPKNVKGGTLCDFLTSIVLQNIETNEGGPFGAIQKVSNSLIVPKKSGAMGDP